MKNVYITLAFAVLLNISLPAQLRWINPIPSGNDISSIFFTDENTCYAAGSFGTIIKSINGGDDWTVLKSGISTRINSLFLRVAVQATQPGIPV